MKRKDLIIFAGSSREALKWAYNVNSPYSYRQVVHASAVDVVKGIPRFDYIKLEGYKEDSSLEDFLKFSKKRNPEIKNIQNSNRILFILAETFEEAKNWAIENKIRDEYRGFTFVSHPDKFCGQYKPHYAKLTNFNKHEFKDWILKEIREREAIEIPI